MNLVMLPKLLLKRDNHFYKKSVRRGNLWFSLFLLLFISCGPEQSEVKKESEKVFREVPNPYGVRDWGHKEARANLKAGDILLKSGKGQISNLVLRVLDEEIPISHGLIVCEKDDGLFLVHSLSHTVSEKDGVQTTSLQNFFSDLRPGTFYALRHRDKKVRERIAYEALEYLKIQPGFDHQYDHRDSSQLYCSELVNNVLVKASGKQYFGIKQVEKFELLSFNELLESKDFTILNKQ